MPLIDKRTIIKNEIDYDKLGQTIANATSDNIDYDKLATAIVMATQTQEKEDNQLREEALKELREKYKIKEDIQGKGIQAYWGKLLNGLRYCRAFLGYNSKQATSPVITFELMRTMSSFFFLVIEIAHIVIGALCIAGAFFNTYWYQRLFTALLGLIAIFMSNFFRVSRLEVEAMTNKEILNIVFSAIMAFLGTAFAFIALFQGGR